MEHAARAVGTVLNCQSLNCVWTTFSDSGFGFGGFFVELRFVLSYPCGFLPIRDKMFSASVTSFDSVLIVFPASPTEMVEKPLDSSTDCSNTHDNKIIKC